MFLSQAIVSLLNQDKQQVGTLFLFADNKRDGSLQVIEENEAEEFGEERIQLVEGCTYEYKLTSVLRKSHLHENSAIIPSRIPNESGDSEKEERERGRIQPGSYTGLLPIVLIDEYGKSLASAAVEVRSSKLSYRQDYRRMIESIAEECVDLLMEMHASVQTRLLPDPGQDSQTLQQRFAFISSMLESREFQDAIQRIIAMPHQHFEGEQTEVDIRRSFRANGTSLRNIARAASRMPLPASHPLSFQLKRYGIEEPSLPSKVTISHNRETVNTHENRFVKHSLTVYSGFLFKIEILLARENSQASRRLHREVQRLREDLDVVLTQDFFREISEPDILPLGSPVLQRKAGYREALQVWLKFDLAARLIWKGGDDVYGSGKRDMGKLYEYWLFFQFLNLLSEQFNMKREDIRKLIEKGEDDFSLRLKSGEDFDIHGKFIRGPRMLHVQLKYNYPFRYSRDRASEGSWTRPMRPDFTISFWPGEFSPSEAERQEIMVHVHFDAKYRVDSIEELIGGPNEDLQKESDEQRVGIFKRADLLKMHTYRDAIRRTEGSYILYLGNRNRLWRGFHEIFPGIGAFAVRPSEDGNVEGLEQISDFLEKVVEHLCDRASRREQLSYHLYRVMGMSANHIVTRPIPEKNYYTHNREVSPAEQYIFVGTYEDIEHLEWIRQNHLYNLAIDTQELPFALDQKLANVHYLLLYGRDATDAKGLFRVTESGLKVANIAELAKLGYPGILNSQEICLVYGIEFDKFFESWHWKIDLIRNVFGNTRVIPFASLIELAEEA